MNGISTEFIAAHTPLAAATVQIYASPEPSVLAFPQSSIQMRGHDFRVLTGRSMLSIVSSRCSVDEA